MVKKTKETSPFHVVEGVIRAIQGAFPPYGVLLGQDHIYIWVLPEGGKEGLLASFFLTGKIKTESDLSDWEVFSASKKNGILSHSVEAPPSSRLEQGTLLCQDAIVLASKLLPTWKSHVGVVFSWNPESRQLVTRDKLL